MDKVGCEVICKNHSARTERDQYRICPTKLTKSELENLYFALLDNNLHLKQTINGQQDRIKVLSTKVQRLSSAQNIICAGENKTCCVGTKAVVNQQKDVIEDLKRSNERMTDRIRKLNMRLCSAKQFCKSATPRGLRSTAATSPYLIKHSARSYKQQSQSTLKLAILYHNLSRDSLVTKYVQTEPDLTECEQNQKSCEDNKCKTVMAEMEGNILDLKEKLCQVQAESLEYNSKMTSLQSELQRSRGEVIASEHEIQRVKDKNKQLYASLRDAEGVAYEMKTQLSIERRRTSELGTQLKVAINSNNVSKSIEDTLNIIQESSKMSPLDVTSSPCKCSTPRSRVERNSLQTFRTTLSPDDNSKLSRSNDDSGFTDTVHTKTQHLLDDQSLNKIIEELTKRIVVLQTQVDTLTVSPPVLDKTKIGIEIIEDRKLKSPNDVEESNINKANVSKLYQEPSVLNEDVKEKTQSTDKRIIDNLGLKDEPNHTFKAESKESNRWHKTVTKLKIITNKSKEKEKINKNEIEKYEENDKDFLENDTVKDNVRDNIETRDNCTKGSSSCDEQIQNNIQIPETEVKVPDINITQRNFKTIKHKIKTVMKINDTIDNNGKKYSNTKDSLRTVNNPKKLNKTDTVEEISREKQGKYKARKSVLNTERHPQSNKRRTKIRNQPVAHDDDDDDDGTYNVEYQRSEDSSPNNTDYEISSMTDITEDRYVPPKSPYKSSLSPGERRLSTSPSYSDTYTPSVNYSLSEGEIPVTCARRRSCDDKQRLEIGEIATAPKMEETLHAITQELALCKRLLHSHKSLEATTSMRL